MSVDIFPFAPIMFTSDDLYLAGVLVFVTGIREELQSYIDDVNTKNLKNPCSPTNPCSLAHSNTYDGEYGKHMILVNSDVFLNYYNSKESIRENIISPSWHQINNIESRISYYDIQRVKWTAGRYIRELQQNVWIICNLFTPYTKTYRKKLRIEIPRGKVDMEDRVPSVIDTAYNCAIREFYEECSEMIDLTKHFGKDDMIVTGHSIDHRIIMMLALKEILTVTRLMQITFMTKEPQEPPQEAKTKSMYKVVCDIFNKWKLW